ncbi:TLD domain-containing protein 1 [Eurytemora carolleeae]|uniref:TLD domain-containing protein 1 n=1 Tax=Eurytemora carolleeae TaxID=1294199 RepID=UPI000C771246|nr:TLD domain-containing protein 1 [Eurytemora carolleeae]|eukprot:XP_023349311.1 TLD domain-containing protein 1-like [Eurytemora affinis]
MGNQLDSGQNKNRLLNDEEIFTLQKHFANRDEKGDLRLGESWNYIEDGLKRNIQDYLTVKGEGISLAKYQDSAANSLKGSKDQQFSFLCMLVFQGESVVQVEKLISTLTSLFSSFTNIYSPSHSGKVECLSLSLSLLHDTLYPGLKRKQTIGAEFDPYIEVDTGTLENIFIYNPLLELVLQNILAHCFQLKHLEFKIGVPYQESIFPLLSLLFLNYNLPSLYKDTWRSLFSIRRDGESFSKFSGLIINRGPSLIIIKDNEGNVFGGYCSSSWKPGPNFIGSSECFLFQLHPQLNIYDSTPFNTNYQYFNLKQKTMPNGLGMGGQLEYFGFWIDAEFGIVRTSPSCSTFHSPQLGVQVSS